MSKITLRKLNESFIKVESNDNGLLYELSDYYSYMASGAKFDYRFKNHLWDGKVRLLSARTGKTLLGLRESLHKFCADRYVECEDLIDENLNPYHNDSAENLDDFIQSLNLPFPPRDYQYDALKHAISSKRSIILSPTGCHAKGSKVVMADGSLKNVEDVVVGDKLVGYNGQTRTVLKLFNHQEMMYKVKPIRSNEFVVNGEHILPLWNAESKKIDYLTVSDYANKTKWYKHVHYLMTNDKEIEFESNVELPLDPYFVGVYLGDGHCSSVAVTTMDEEIVSSVYSIAEEYDLNVVVKNNGSRANTYSITKQKGMENPIAKIFREIGLNVGISNDALKCHSKHIPEIYLTASIDARYQLLAGLIDTDGCISTNGSFYDFCVKSKSLRDDVVRLARSLGFNTSTSTKFVNGNPYYRLHILGDIEKIPVRVKRKVKTKTFNPNKDPHHESFDIEQMSVGEYYGFMLDGDHLYYNDNYILQHNSGKSLLLYMWVRWHLKKGRKIALIVPNIGLLKQMENDFREYSAKDTTWNIDEEITLLGGKHKANAFDVDKCLLTTWQSLIKYDKETMATFDVVTVDECHASKASSIKSILETSVNAPFRLGVTGSLDGELINTMLITGLFGEVKQYVSTVELQSKGSLSDLAIHSITLEYPKEDRIELNALLKTKEYMKEIDFLNEHKVRNTFITNLACKSKGTVLVLFRYTKHGRLIHQMISDTLKKMGINRPLHYIDGSVDNREEIRTNINEGENAILVASVQTTATGLNIPSIEHIIYACPFKGRILGLQSVGRGLRLSEGKTYCNLYDICDDLQYRRKRNYSLKWSADRLLIFIEQGFKINYKKLTLPNRKE